MASLLLIAAERSLAQDAPDTVAAWSASFDERVGSLGSAGDVNADGVDDIIVCVPYWPDPAGNDAPAGRAYVFLGHCGDLPSATPDWIAQGESWFWDFGLDPGWWHWRGSVMGSQCGSAGDVNGDGYGDVFVVEYSWSSSHGDPEGPECDPVDSSCPWGRVLVWHGGPAGLTGSGAGSATPHANWTWTGAEAPFSPHVAAHDPAIIAWTVRFEGACDDAPLDAGITRNRVYVMFGEPDPTMPMCAESVFGIACRGVNAGGSDVNYLVDQVNYNFETPDDAVASHGSSPTTRASRRSTSTER